MNCASRNYVVQFDKFLLNLNNEISSVFLGQTRRKALELNLAALISCQIAWNSFTLI